MFSFQKECAFIDSHVTSDRGVVSRYRTPSFEGDFPACSLVEVSALADPRILVEIEGVAHLGQSA